MPRGKDPRIISLRAVRKASHIGRRSTQKMAGAFGRVENKTTRMMINSTGSIDGKEVVPVTDYIYRQYPYTFPVHPALPMIGQRPSVTVFGFLDPRGFYGGIATLLITAASLANELGYDLRVAQTTGYSDKTDVLGFLRSNNITIEPNRYSTINISDRNHHKFAYLPLHPDDVVLVSAWWDARVAEQLPLSRKFVYLIQDYEPIFYNNSDESVMADQTYFSEKFIPLCNTEILYEFFKQNGYDYIAKNAAWFEPAPAPAVKAKTRSGGASSKKKLFLYGRPNVHRNLFYTALQALDIAFNSDRINGDWEIYLAGQGDIPNFSLQSGQVVKNLGKMDIADYYKFAAGIDVAVSPMLAPHPNYPTLELASLGAAVVTTKWKTKQDLSRYSKNIVMADPQPDAIAEAIILAANTDPETLQSNMKDNHIGADWPLNMAAPIKKVKSRLGI